MSDTPTVPASRREVWLTIALAVARDGLPEPADMTLHSDLRTLDLNFDSSFDDAATWAKHTGAKPERERPVLSDDRERLIHVWWGAGCYLGWTVTVRATVPVSKRPAPSPLAAEVAAAILTPDAAPVPAGSAA